MQILPLIGSTLLVLGAGYAVFLAMQHEPLNVPLIGDTTAQQQAGQSARVIELTPNQRNDTYYTAITNRPLFEQTRRPVSQNVATEPEIEIEVPQAAAPAQPPELPAPDLRLLGVLSGGARNAALLSVAGDDPQWLREGATVDGWALSSIASDHVILTENEREIRVELYQR